MPVKFVIGCHSKGTIHQSQFQSPAKHFPLTKELKVRNSSVGFARGTSNAATSEEVEKRMRRQAPTPFSSEVSISTVFCFPEARAKVGTNGNPRESFQPTRSGPVNANVYAGTAPPSIGKDNSPRIDRAERTLRRKNKQNKSGQIKKFVPTKGGGNTWLQ